MNVRKQKFAQDHTGQGTSIDDLLSMGLNVGGADPEPERRADPPKKNSTMREIADSGIALGSGVVGGTKSIADAFGADNKVSQVLGEANDALTNQYSDSTKAKIAKRQKLIDEADASDSTMQQIIARMGALKDRPVDTVLGAFGSMAPTVAATVATGGLGGVAVGAVQGAGGVKGGIHDDVKKSLIDAGVPREEAEARATQAQEYNSKNAAQIATGAVLGAIDGRIGVEGAVNKLVNGAEKTATMGRRVAQHGLEEAVPEAVQGAQQQYAQNVAVAGEGIARDPMQGVVGEGVSQGVVGGIAGGIAGAPRPRAPRVPEAGPMSRAANAGADAADATGMPMDAAGAAAAADQANAQAQATAAQQQTDEKAKADAALQAAADAFTDRAAKLQAALGDPSLPDKVRQATATPENPAGSLESVLEAKRYADLAMKANLPQPTRENFLSMAERLLGLQERTPQGAPQLGAPEPQAPAGPQQQLPAPDAPNVPRLGVDYATDDNGQVMSVDGQGNARPQFGTEQRAAAPALDENGQPIMAVGPDGAARPQTRDEAIAAQQAAEQAAADQAERESLGRQELGYTHVEPIEPGSNGPRLLANGSTPSDGMVVDGDGNVRQRTRADDTAASQAQGHRQVLGKQTPRGGQEAPRAPAAAKQLPHAPTTTERLIADADGVLRPETGEEATRRREELEARGAEAKRKADIGLTPDIERVVKTRDIGQADGKPLKNKTAARKIQKREGGEIVDVPGGFKVRVPDAEANGVVDEMRGLAEQFRQRHAESGADQDKTFASVLDEFADDVAKGDRTPDSVRGMVDSYHELAKKPIKAKTAEASKKPEDDAPSVSADPAEPAEGQLTEKQNAAADRKIANAKAASARARRRLQLDVENDTMLQALTKMGGLRRDIAAREFGMKPEELKHTVQVGGLRGSPFRATGGMDLDRAVTNLQEAGYFAGVPDEDVVRAFEEHVFNEMGGSPKYSVEGEMRRAAEKHQDDQADQAQREADRLTEIEQELQDRYDLREMSEDDLDLLSEELERERAQETADAAGSNGSDSSAAAGQARAGAQGDSEGEGPVHPRPAFGLESHSLDDLEARAEKADQVEADRRAADKKAADKAKADADVAEFTLTGSDRAADSNPDQFDLLGGEPPFSRSAIKSPEANVRRGKAAMNKALTERADQNRAMYRSDLGWIDFVWGDAKRGLAHIIERRQAADGLSRDEVVRMLTGPIVETIAKGAPDPRPTRVGTSTRVAVEHAGHRVILVRRDGANGWLVTGFELHSAGSPGKGSDLPGDTQTAPIRTRRGLGAGEKSPGEGGDASVSPPMSRRNGAAATPDAARVKAVADTIAAGWKGAPEIHVLSTFDEAPEAVRESYEAQANDGSAGSPEGFLHNGEVYLVADKLPGLVDVARVLMHESLGHYGLRGVFGKRLSSILDQLAASRPDLMAAKRAEYGNRTDRVLAEEVLADLAQTHPTLPLVRRAIVAIRDFLRSIGFKSLKLSDDEIISMAILPARAFVVHGPSVEPQSKADPAKADGAEEPKLSRAKADPMPEWAGKNASLRSALGKIDTYAPKATLVEKVKAMSSGWREKLVAGMIDAYAPLQKLSQDAYIAARMTKAAPGAFEGMLLYGKPVMNADGSLSGDLDGKGFIGAMKELGGEHDRFFAWVAGNRAERLAGEGRENLFTADEIQAMTKLNADGPGDTFAGQGSRRDAYRKAAQALHAYNKSVMDIAEKAGLIDGEARHLWEHEFYIPFYRVMDETGSTAGPGMVKGLVRQKAFQKLKGGTDNLGDLMENTLANWSLMLSASLSNLAAKKALEAAAAQGGAIEQREAAAKQMAKDAGIKGHATFFMDGGEQRWFVVDDPLVLAAVSAMQPVGVNGIPMKIMGAFKKYLTLGTTIAPAFKMRNLVRDTIAAPASNEMSFNVFKNLVDGWKLTDTKDAEYAQMLFGGALMRFGPDEGSRAEMTKKLIADGVDSATILDSKAKITGFLKKAFHHYQEFGDRLENVNRAALYRQLREQGKSHREAAFQARDMMDFGMGGAWPAMRLLTQAVPFMNARVQGLYKLGRAAHANPKRFATVAGAVALASIAMMLANQDDNEWKKRKDWDRDNYWWFKLGDMAFRLPKPFEIGALGTIAERTVELMVSDEMTGKRFGQRMMAMLEDTLSMNPTPQVFKPLVDLYANKSFTGAAIESRAMENLPKPDRIGPDTSSVAKALGAAGDYTGISPVQVDHMIHAYFGWLGWLGSTVVDTAVAPLEDGQKPAMTIDDVSGGFLKRLPAQQSRYVDELYDQGTQAVQLIGAIKQARLEGDGEKAAEILADNPGIESDNKAFNGAERQMSKINAKIKAVRADPDMNADEKRAALDTLTAQKNALAERVTTAVRTRREALRQ